jgi:hypothetical protein
VLQTVVLAREQTAVLALLRLTWLVTTAFVLSRLRGRALLMATAIVRPIRAVTTTTTTVAATTTMHAVAVLVAVALVAITLVAITLVAITLVAITLVAISLVVTVLP